MAIEPLLMWSRFAYVDFKSEEDQKLAIELSERLLEGRKLLIKLGTSAIPHTGIQRCSVLTGNDTDTASRKRLRPKT